MRNTGTVASPTAKTTTAVILLTSSWIPPSVGIARNIPARVGVAPPAVARTCAAPARMNATTAVSAGTALAVAIATQVYTAPAMRVNTAVTAALAAPAVTAEKDSMRAMHVKIAHAATDAAHASFAGLTARNLSSLKCKISTMTCGNRLIRCRRWLTSTCSATWRLRRHPLVHCLNTSRLLVPSPI